MNIPANQINCFCIKICESKSNDYNSCEEECQINDVCTGVLNDLRVNPHGQINPYLNCLGASEGGYNYGYLFEYEGGGSWHEK